MRHFAFRRKPAKDAGVLGQRIAGAGGVVVSDRTLAHGVQEKRRQAVTTGGEVLAAIAEELAAGQRGQLPHYWKQLAPLFDVVQLSDECLRLLAAPEVEPMASPAEPVVPEYLVSSWFLADCHAYLAL